MSPEEYMAAKTAAVASALVTVRRIAALTTQVALSPFQWFQLLQSVFPEVERGRFEVASLARTFYDSERSKHVPNAPRNNRPLVGTSFAAFARNMEPARRPMSEAESSQSAVTHFTLRMAREIENAGRAQIIRAVEDDPYVDELIEEEPERDRYRSPVLDITERLSQSDAPRNPALVKGWARVATGRETCAWCLMLISRGPVYRSAGNAGVLLDDETVIDAWNESGHDLGAFQAAVDDSMDEWHAGCDCIVVPVFSTSNWVGRDAHQRANQLWIDASNEAAERIESGEARSDNIGTETLNALRRRLDRGEVEFPSYAYAA